MHVVGEDDPGVDVKGCAGTHSANCIAQCVDIRHQQVRAPIKQVYGKEEGPAWNSITAIIRHLRSMHGRGERRKALRSSALRLLIRASGASLVDDTDLSALQCKRPAYIYLSSHIIPWLASLIGYLRIGGTICVNWSDHKIVPSATPL